MNTNILALVALIAVLWTSSVSGQVNNVVASNNPAMTKNFAASQVKVIDQCSVVFNDGPFKGKACGLKHDDHIIVTKGGVTTAHCPNKVAIVLPNGSIVLCKDLQQVKEGAVIVDLRFNIAAMAPPPATLPDFAPVPAPVVAPLPAPATPLVGPPAPAPAPAPTPKKVFEKMPPKRDP